MTITLAHTEDCMCVACMMADMDAHVAANGGTVYVTEKTAAEKTRNAPAGQRSGRGYVRTISTRQVALIVKLIGERDLTNLSLLPGQTIDPKLIHTMGVKGGSALIEKLFNCPIILRDSVSITNQGSVKQQAFLQSLMAKVNLSESDINGTYSNISEAITALIALSKSAPKQNTNAVTEGMYKVGTRIFKVQKARQSTNLYAKELVDGSFEYVAGAITLVRNEGVRMTLDEAKAYGKATGQCCNCGRELTVKESIEAGIGPVCAAKF